jgi:hypothetical protein
MVIYADFYAEVIVSGDNAKEQRFTQSSFFYTDDLNTLESTRCDIL